VFGLDYSILKRQNWVVLLMYIENQQRDLLVLRALPNVTGFRNVLGNIGEVQNQELS